MSHHPPPHTRAPRVSLRGAMSAIVKLENGRQLPAKLHQLSVTGGLMEIATYVEERSRVALTLEVGSSIVRAWAETLFPMWGAMGNMQPFRFTDLPAYEHRRLEKEITQLLKQTTARATVGQGPGYRQPRFFLESF